jgi:pyruvate,water dikinase
MAQPDRDLVAELTALAGEREARLAEVRTRLRDYPAPVLGQFEFLLAAAQAGNVLLEDHAHWIDHRATSQVLWELGRRLVADGVLETADDLDLLTIDEVRETVIVMPQTGWHGLVAARRAEMEHFAAITPPATLGVPPEGAPPDNPLVAAMQKFFGAPPIPAQAGGEVRGHAGSPGRARGTARVLRSLNDAHRLQAGDILVAETTGPSWTPLFATAAAVVTDTGGILSHSASLAREYRLPAVVGTAVATQQIPDGAVVDVDGDNGLIRLVG